MLTKKVDAVNNFSRFSWLFIPAVMTWLVYFSNFKLVNKESEDKEKLWDSLNRAAIWIVIYVALTSMIINQLTREPTPVRIMTLGF